MKIEEIKELIEIFEKSSVCKMDYKDGDISLKLKKKEAYSNNNGSSPLVVFNERKMESFSDEKSSSPKEHKDNHAEEKSENSENKVNGEWVKAPFVGVFYRAASEGARPYVEVGDKIEVGDCLCILEAMKVMNEIKSTKKGTVLEIKAKNGNMVEYDEDLILIGE